MYNHFSSGALSFLWRPTPENSKQEKNTRVYIRLRESSKDNPLNFIRCRTPSFLDEFSKINTLSSLNDNLEDQIKTNLAPVTN
jgi:hypothetical protein